MFEGGHPHHGIATVYPNTNLLPVTGQTTDRSVAGRTSKDDGYEQQGQARSFTSLTTGQYAGTTDIVVNSVTDTRSNACVQDEQTGLMWTATMSASVGPFADGRLYWDDANESIWHYVDYANSISFAGHNDWRIPSITELLQLCDLEVGEPPSAYFTDWASIHSAFSCTTSHISSGSALVFTAYASSIGIAPLTKTSSNWLLLVRG